MFRVVVSLLIVLTSASIKPTSLINERSSGDKSPSKREGLLAKIEAARKQLEGEQVRLIEGVVGVRKVKTGRRSYKEVSIKGIVGREMAIAVMDAGGKINNVRAMKRETGLEVLTPGYVLHMRKENGINSDIASIKPAGGKVLAVKYPISNEGNRFGASTALIEAVYTPYSAEINTEEVIDHGVLILDQFIEQAYAHLDKRGVESKAFAGRKITDVIPRSVLRVLLMNEHIDPGEFKTEGMTSSLVERVLAIIATNGRKAYAYSISRAGARGLVQMIASTYSRLLSRYPTAGLTSSFALGMGDPINAVVAQILLCDADWQAIRTVSDIPANKIGPYLAAAYNGGVGRVLTILRNNKTAWMEAPHEVARPTVTVKERVAVKVRGRRGRVQTKYVLKSYTQPIFRNETSKYVSQYHWINSFLAVRE